MGTRIGEWVPRPEADSCHACSQFWARSVLFCVGFVSVRWRVIDDGGPYYASNIPRTLSRKCVYGQCSSASHQCHAAWSDAHQHLPMTWLYEQYNSQCCWPPSGFS